MVKIISLCSHCNIEISDVKKRKFCSYNCYWKWMSYSKEHRDNLEKNLFQNLSMRNPISKAKIISKLKGRSLSPRTQFKKGDKGHLGFTHSKETKEAMRLKNTNPSFETRKRMSMAKTKENTFSGFRRPQSKIIRSSYKYSQWRSSVFVRDNWTCRECNKKGGILEAHHIKSFAKYPKLRFDINNGLTYCNPCHIKLDKNRGRLK